MQDIIYSQYLSDLLKAYHKSYKNYDVNEIFLTAGVLGMVGIGSHWDTNAIVKMGRKIEQSIQEGYEIYNFGCDDNSWYLIARSEEEAELQLRSIIETATNQRHI
jgi:hypothetical protein